MNPNTVAVILWFAKLFQFIGAIILTPEIIGPDRFERLEKRFESQDFSKKTQGVLVFGYILAAILMCPWFLMDVLATYSNVSGENVAPHIGLPAAIVLLLVYLVGLAFIAKPFKGARLLQLLLVRFTNYLRKASLFRTIAITLAVLLFVTGSLTELLVQWPF